MFRTILSLSLAAGLALGCGGTNPTGDDDDPMTGGDPDAAPTDGGDDAIAYDDLFAAIAGSYCKRVFACCDDVERKLIGIIPFTDERPDIPTVEACTAYMADWTRRQGRLAFLADVAADGTVTYDGERAAECVSQYAAISCDEFGHDVRAVLDMRACSPFVASRAAGDACDYDEQCPTEYCASAADGSAQVCSPQPVEGEACQVGQCADGLFCGFADGVCHATLADGADCVFHEDCQSRYCSYDFSEGDTGFCSVAETWLCDGE